LYGQSGEPNVRIVIDGSVALLRQTLFQKTYFGEEDQLLYLNDAIAKTRWQIDSYDLFSNTFSSTVYATGDGDISPNEPSIPRFAWGLFESCESSPQRDGCTRPFAENIQFSIVDTEISSPTQLVSFQGDAEGNYYYRLSMVLDYGQPGRPLFTRLRSNSNLFTITHVRDVIVRYVDRTNGWDTIWEQGVQSKCCFFLSKKIYIYFFKVVLIFFFF
jgi:hypothetical protein